MFDDNLFDFPPQNNNKEKKENEIMKLIISEIGKASEYIYLNTSMLYKISQIINNSYYDEEGAETHVYYYDEDADGDSIDEFIENLKKEMKKKRDELDE